MGGPCRNACPVFERTRKPEGNAGDFPQHSPPAAPATLGAGSVAAVPGFF